MNDALTAISFGFPPLLGDRPRLLLLGTFPGEASLRAGEYYAHPRNLFWEMMDAVCGAGRQLPYDARCRVLTAAGIAVWDVLGACRRQGSVDSRIEPEGLRPNAVADLIAVQDLRAIACNGQGAARLFERWITPTLSGPCPELVVLPSTSPAHARLTREQKRQQWLVLRHYLGDA